MPSEQVDVVIRARDLAGRIIARVDRRLDAFAQSAKRVALGLVAFTAGAGFAVKELFGLGASVVETESKFDTVFGSLSAMMDRFVQDFSNMAGLTQREAKELTATTGAIAQGFGFTGEASAQLAQQVVRLGGDLASFNNLQGGTAEGIAIINSLLTGEFERGKRVGIVIRALEVDQRALANSGKRVVSELTEQERVTARLQLATEKAGVAVGDLARTMDSPANQARRIRAEFKQIAEDFATDLLPTLEDLLPTVRELVRLFGQLAQKGAQAITTITDALGITDPDLRAELAAIQNLPARNLRRREAGLTREIEDLRREVLARGGADAFGTREFMRQLIVAVEARQAVRRRIEAELQPGTLAPIVATAAPPPRIDRAGLRESVLGLPLAESGLGPPLPFPIDAEKVAQAEAFTDALDVLGDRLDKQAQHAQFMADTIASEFSFMAATVIGDSDRAASAVIAMIARIVAASQGGVFGTIVTGVGGILSSLLGGSGRAEVPVRLASVEPRAADTLERARQDQQVVHTVQFIDVFGNVIAELESGARRRTRRDAVGRLPGGLVGV